MVELSFEMANRPSNSHVRDAMLDDGLINNNVNIKTNCLGEKIGRTSGCGCAELLIDPSF